MMGNTGGGLITNGRTQEDNRIPKTPPMKAPQQASQPPQQAMPQQAPMPAQGVPQQQAPQGMPPQQMPPQGGPQAAPQGGMPPQQGGQQAPEGVNTIANNMLRLFHDPQASQQLEQMISQGPRGAAQAAVTVGMSVVGSYSERGIPIDDEEAADAAMELMADISEMGVAQGYLPEEPMIGGIPASVRAATVHSLEMWSQQFPEFGAEMGQAMQEASPQDQQEAQQLAEYMRQTENPAFLNGGQQGQQAPQQQPQQPAPQMQQPPQGLIQQGMPQ